MKRTRVKPRSRRNITEAAIRKEIRTGLGGSCTIGPVLDDLGVAGGCGRTVAGKRQYGPVEGLHERRKASSGGSKVYPPNLMPACIPCNGLIEDCVGADREKVEASCLVVREGDPEWDEMGRRLDRFR